MHLYRPREVIRVLEAFGYQHTRTKGDHAILTKRRTRSVPVPLSQREIKARLFHQMLREAGVSVEEFEEMARRVL